MRKLIISLPRTGSSTLLFDLAKEYNLKPIFEPFDGTNRHTYNKDEDDIIVKTIIFQHNDNVELSKNFDSIILLSRKDMISCAESYTYFCKNRRKGFQSYFPYFYEDVTDEELKQTIETLKKYDQDLKNLSTTLGIPITYYEDIYDVDSVHRLRKPKKELIIKNKMI